MGKLSAESCTIFKSVPALALYLGAIHFNIIFILFATFFLPLSKALLFVLFSSSLLYPQHFTSISSSTAFSIFMLGSLVCSSSSSSFLWTTTAYLVENCPSISFFFSFSFSFSFQYFKTNYLGNFLLAKFQIHVQAHLLLFSHKASRRTTKSLSS